MPNKNHTDDKEEATANSLRSDFQSSRDSNRITQSATVMKVAMEQFVRNTLFSGCKFIPDGQLEAATKNPIKHTIAKEIGYSDPNDPEFLTFWRSKSGIPYVKKLINKKRSSVTTSMRKEVKRKFLCILCCLTCDSVKGTYLTSPFFIIILGIHNEDPQKEDFLDMDRISDLWDDKQCFMQMMDWFLKTVLSDKTWKTNFERGNCRDFWSVVSKCDIAFVMFVLDTNLNNWLKEFQDGEKPRKEDRTSKYKEEKLNRYNGWNAKVKMMFDSHSAAIAKEYVEHREQLRRDMLGTGAVVRPPKKARVIVEVPEIDLDFLGIAMEEV